nr:cyclin-dependent protein kinase inhibitor SMR2 [Ipomoea batatas]
MPAHNDQQKPKVSEEENGAGQSKVDDEGCRTPTGQRHKIPAIGSCPPAPKRARKRLLGKRKVSSQIEFFENGSGRCKEIEVLFASLSELSRVAPAALKKRLFVSQ